MLTTIIYVIGALSLQFTDMQSQHPFFNLLLPFINILFFIFLLWQLLFYFSLNSFSNGHDSHFFDLLYRLWHLDEEIEDNGFFKATFSVSLLLINAVCLFTAVLYYLAVFLDFVG